MRVCSMNWHLSPANIKNRKIQYWIPRTGKKISTSNIVDFPTCTYSSITKQDKISHFEQLWERGKSSIYIC